MAFTLDKVVPWGRSFEEYVAMFALTERDVEKSILGCGDGPASFNQELTARGGRVVSVDPLYAFSRQAIENRIDEAFPKVVAQARRNRDEFVWTTFTSVEELAAARRQAMNHFLADYEAGRAEGRYVEGGLPVLPFEDRAFDLALCSHFLFLYSSQFSASFHYDAIRELLRVADEVRVFPLLELGSKPSRHLDVVMEQVEEDGYTVRIEQVDYEFQKGGCRMLWVSAV